MNRSTPPFNDLPAVDVAIIGGGLAGSICALLLARQGIGVAIIDPFKVYPADFRCEKLTRDQIKRTTRLGIDGPLLEAAAPVTETVVARNGRAIDLRSVNEVCQRYDTMVNAVRRAWPDQVVFHEGRAAGIATSTGEQIVTLTSGARLKARLVILATGPGEKLRANLGLQRRAVRYNHSVCIGFDLVNGTGGPISRRALTYYGEKPGDGVAFATVFPFGNRTRCNVFCYLDPAGAQISAVRANPIAGLATLLPGLIPILGNDVRTVGRTEIRITDLYEIDEPARNGVVLAGEAFRPSCPVTGTGVTRVLCDAEQLCRIHIPHWLQTPGMEASKIAAFYGDPSKRKVDQASVEDAERQRRFAVDRSRLTVAQRLAAFVKSTIHFAILMKPRAVLTLHPAQGPAQSYSAAAALADSAPAAGRDLSRAASPRIAV